MVTEEQRQKDKEQAVLFALQHGMALIRKGLEIHAMKKDGSTVFISQSNSYNVLWHDALLELNKRFKQK